VSPAFDPKALLSRSYTLERGPRVRLRLPANRDESAIRALLARAGADDHELEAVRLARPDPRRRLVIVATGLVGFSETLLGVGAIELGDEPAVSTSLYVDDEQTEGLAELLDNALRTRATAIARARAA
jgi:hypothetical protein